LRCVHPIAAGASVAPIHMPAVSRQDEKRAAALRTKMFDSWKERPQKLLHAIRRAISRAQPNHLRRSRPQDTAVMKIQVFGYDGEAMPESKIPDHHVRCRPQSAVVNMRRLRK